MIHLLLDILKNENRQSITACSDGFNNIIWKLLVVTILKKLITLNWNNGKTYFKNGSNWRLCTSRHLLLLKRTFFWWFDVLIWIIPKVWNMSMENTTFVNLTSSLKIKLSKNELFPWNKVKINSQKLPFFMGNLFLLHHIWMLGKVGDKSISTRNFKDFVSFSWIFSDDKARIKLLTELLMKSLWYPKWSRANFFSIIKFK